jgi:hypothetical protein
MFQLNASSAVAEQLNALESAPRQIRAWLAELEMLDDPLPECLREFPELAESQW